MLINPQFSSVQFSSVEINSGVHLLKSEIRHMPLFTSGCLGLVLGLVCSGLRLGLVTLVLVLTLRF